MSRDVIEEMFAAGILINKNMLESILKSDLDTNLLDKLKEEPDILVLNTDYTSIVQQTHLVDWYDLDHYRVEMEQNRDNDIYQQQIQNIFSLSESLSLPSDSLATNPLATSPLTTISATDTTSTVISSSEITPLVTPSLEISSATTTSLNTIPSVTIINPLINIPHKYTIKDFTRFFISRYRFIENILRSRQELKGVMAINRVLGKKEKEKVAIIGVVSEIGETKQNNLMLTIEDLTGQIKVFVGKKKNDLFTEARNIVVDEVIGIAGVCGGDIIFAENLVWPDLPRQTDLKKGPEEEYVIFLSDIHVGSTFFLTEEFNKFLKWMQGGLGNEKQRKLIEKIKYVVIAGDIVDGVGIYPGQDEELSIIDIKSQYAEFSRLIKKIPLDKQIIICPGNHDVVHLAEPQSIFHKNYASDLFNLPNVTLVTNPSLVKIGKTESFSGFDVLLYHGASFDYYVRNVESIRNNGGYHRADLIMKFLLKRRHLAPSFGSTPYYPGHNEDPLLIKQIPDFFISGHIHYSCVANYRGVTMISGSCWQGKTDFQEKLGHEPEPGRVPLINLKTREVKILRFI